MAGSDSNQISSFVSKLWDIGVIKLGQFTLKSGISSPVYIDFRLIVSYPLLLKEACELLSGIIDRELSGKFDKICGVPLAALPIATVLSSHTLTPMVMRRQQMKAYGTGKKIEGCYEAGDRVLVLEDVVTSGGSVLETVRDLREAGMCVSDTLVLLDRQQGGAHHLAEHNVTIHSLFTIDQLLDCIDKSNKVSSGELARVRESLRSPPTAQTLTSPVTTRAVRRGLLTRQEELRHPLARKLAGLVREKRTNLVLSADVNTCTELLHLAEQTGPYICMLKLHTDALTDMHTSLTFIQELRALSNKHRFLLCEDRKLADIGSTVTRQYEQLGWADLVTVHSVAGPGALKAIREVLVARRAEKERGCLLVSEMSCEGNLITSEYTASTLQLAEEYKDCVVGLICQQGADKPSSLLCLTPGVKLTEAGAARDDLFQTYTDPKLAVKEKGADLLVVGRGILLAPDHLQAAKMYSQVGYEALTSPN